MLLAFDQASEKKCVEFCRLLEPIVESVFGTRRRNIAEKLLHLDDVQLHLLGHRCHFKTVLALNPAQEFHLGHLKMQEDGKPRQRNQGDARVYDQLGAQLHILLHD